MTGKKLAKSIAAAAVAMAVAFAFPVGGVPAQASSISEMQQQQADLKKQQQAIEAQIEKLKNDKSKQQQYKNALDSQIRNVEQQIDSLNAQVGKLDADIVAKQNEIAGKQKEIDANFQKLKERVYALYLTGEASNIEIVLDAKNIMDLADKAELMRVIAEHDTSLINTLKSDMNSVKAQKAEIEQSRAAVASKKTEMDQNRQKLNQLEADADKVIAQLDANQQQQESSKAKIAAERKQVDAQIDQWFADYYAEQQRKKQQQQQQQQGGGSGGYQGTGNFAWPVPSYSCISQGYGSYDMGSFHKGIDIAASYGLPIVAADSGTVVWAGYQEHGLYGGYGNVVVIDHGNGYMTLYAHMSSIAVSAGQQVTKRQTIGYIGSTGESTGNHCHFEIRKNGGTVNPMNYFA